MKFSLVLHVKVMNYHDPRAPLLYEIPGPGCALATQLSAAIANKLLESNAVRFQEGQRDLTEDCYITVVFGNYSDFHSRSPRPPSRQYSPKFPSSLRYSLKAENSLDVIVAGM